MLNTNNSNTNEPQSKRQRIVSTNQNIIHKSDRFNFNLCPKNIQITEYNTLATCNSDTYCTVYGKNIISSTKNGLYIWKFESIGSKIFGIVIGIDNAIGKWTKNQFCNIWLNKAKIGMHLMDIQVKH